MGIVLFIYSFIGWVWECALFLCETPGKPRIYVQADAADLWIRSACGLDQYDQSQRQYSKLIFLFGMVGATLLEYVTGAVMETFQCEILITAIRNLI